MPGEESGGVGNFWYSFDYGNAHFISIDGETDYANSAESPFVADLTGNETLPMKNETKLTNSGPFGYIHGNYKDNEAYEQIAWLKNDLASIDREKTPWVFAMSHRPMYSSEVYDYQKDIRNAFESLLIQYKVDAYFAGHIHWYERIWPMNNMSIVPSDILDNNTYATGTGNSLTTLVNGMAGNVESHSSLNESEILDYTAVLNQYEFGFSKLTIHNNSHATWQYIKGIDGSVGDTLTMVHAP
jgi:acid phosphatase